VATRIYEPPDEEVFDEADILEQGLTLQQQIRDVVLPQIARRSQASADTVPTKMRFFRKKTTGRRCSCFFWSTAPRSTCRTCFGEGVVGGFEKLGYREEVIDITRLDVRAVNVFPRFDKQTAPVRFSLTQNAALGFFEVDVPLFPNHGVLDAFRADYTVQPDRQVRLFLRAPSDGSTWHEVTAQTYADLITARLGEAKLSFRAEFSRVSPDAPLPELDAIYLRYQTGTMTELSVEVNRTAHALTADEMGLFDAYEDQDAFLDGRVKVITTEDFFEEIETGRRWKVKKANPGFALGTTFEHSLTLRYIQDYKERYKLVP